eukprot:3135835-Rhodomonas_salina.1
MTGSVGEQYAMGEKLVGCINKKDVELLRLTKAVLFHLIPEGGVSVQPAGYRARSLLCAVRYQRFYCRHRGFLPTLTRCCLSRYAVYVHTTAGVNGWGGLQAQLDAEMQNMLDDLKKVCLETTDRCARRV